MENLSQVSRTIREYDARHGDFEDVNGMRYFENGAMRETPGDANCCLYDPTIMRPQERWQNICYYHQAKLESEIAQFNKLKAELLENPSKESVAELRAARDAVFARRAKLAELQENDPSKPPVQPKPLALSEMTIGQWKEVLFCQHLVRVAEVDGEIANMQAMLSNVERLGESRSKPGQKDWLRAQIKGFKAELVRVKAQNPSLLPEAEVRRLHDEAIEGERRAEVAAKRYLDERMKALKELESLKV